LSLATCIHFKVYNITVDMVENLQNGWSHYPSGIRNFYNLYAAFSGYTAIQNYILVKAPPWVQHEKKVAWGHVGEKPMPEYYFFIFYECGGALTGLLVDKSFVLATFSDSKLVMHMTNSAIFSRYSALYFPYAVLYFWRVLYGKK